MKISLSKTTHIALCALTLVAALLTSDRFISNAQAQIYRCGNTYSQQPCESGKGGRQLEVPTPQSRHSGQSPRKVYLCQGYGGGQFWSSTACTLRGDSTLLREVIVPQGMSWEDAVNYASGIHNQAERLRSQNTVIQRYQTPDNSSVCESYRQMLQHNASAARAGGTAARMERLAEERRRILAAQSAAGCSG